MAVRFNRMRYERIHRLLGIQPTDHILDLGCGAEGRSVADWNHVNQITGMDLLPPEDAPRHGANFRYIQHDATDLGAFPPRTFDVILGIGLLEHLGDDARLARLFSEVRRAGDRYAFVVPHRFAFVEPHYKLPLFPVWPDHLKTLGLRITGRGHRRSPARWRRVRWPSRAHWLRIADDPTVHVFDHWYGPFLMYYLIVGGRWGRR